MIERDTVFSPDRRYRYVLWREWGLAAHSPYVMFVGLNSSTANEDENDPTIRRCIGFTKAWGFSALCMTNLFAYAARDPREMKRQSDPVGPENDVWLERCAKDSSLIIIAWGVHGKYKDRDRAVERLLSYRDLYCVGLTKDGHPRHPLYARRGQWVRNYLDAHMAEPAHQGSADAL